MVGTSLISICKTVQCFILEVLARYTTFAVVTNGERRIAGRAHSCTPRTRDSESTKIFKPLLPSLEASQCVCLHASMSLGILKQKLIWRDVCSPNSRLACAGVPVYFPGPVQSTAASQGGAAVSAWSDSSGHHDTTGSQALEVCPHC